ncbi:fructose-bisphosphate aldolase [Microbacterium sp. Root61]|uniref:class II fructose-bisphosphate aldolase n=1 Tax=Microbacterium sp. Root61 TaxID=1736570 RepID=UPI0006F54FAF|nr:class II fructose-bisphosphate aldolase [Microbacterium sp. Root61]KRA24936.1 fructose-bisphosphate aldolase [Microbacterium sp. Root61]
MTLVATRTLIDEAVRSRSAVGAFNVIQLETAEALVQAAVDSGLPMILQISENCVRFHGGLDPLARAVIDLAQGATAELAVHLDHAEDERLASRAIDLGFSSVMYDGSLLGFAENMAATRRIVAHAHAAGASVEAELGEIGGKDGAHAPGVRTDPDEATLFVGETGVDFLAVAVGSSHAMTSRDARLDIDLIARLAEAAPIPLVLHGSSGVADDEIVRAIHAGIRKVNVSTHLNGIYTDAIRQWLDAHESDVDPRRYVRPARDAVAVEAARLQRIFAADLVEAIPAGGVTPLLPPAP